jgi:RNA polymerase sigma-70 factor (ECF subfamily)
VIREDPVRPVVGGDAAETQLVELMNRYQQPLVSYVTLLLRDHHLSLDVAQETFVRAYQNLCDERPVNARWLWTVARNLAINELRARKRHGGSEEILEQTLDETTCESDEIRAVRRAMDALSAEDREVLYLHIVDRFRSEEIASMLDTRATAVRMRLVRARRRFRAIYRGNL